MLSRRRQRAYLYVERGYQVPGSEQVVLWILFGLAAVLMLGGTLTATFLALSDARPDLATLSAVGASPRTRRAVAAAYAVSVGLVGAVLGAAVGFVPGIAISYPLTRSYAPAGPVALPRHPVAGDHRSGRAAAPGDRAGGRAARPLAAAPGGPAGLVAESAQRGSKYTPSRRKEARRSRRVVRCRLGEAPARHGMASGGVVPDVSVGFASPK